MRGRVACLLGMFAVLLFSAPPACDPMPEPPEEAYDSEPDFRLWFVWGRLGHMEVEQLGCTVTATVSGIHADDTETECSVDYEYASGETHSARYELQVDTFLYDAEGMYLVLSADDFIFEVDASYLPQTAYDEAQLRFRCEGEMTVYWGMLEETLPLNPEFSDTGAYWALYYIPE